MALKIKRVAVIGAGPSGGIAVDALAREQAFDVIRVFERKKKVGGTWVFTPDLEPKIPSLQELVKQPQNGDIQVPLPAQLPAQTPKTTEINSHQLRFSDTPMHEHLESNIGADVMSYTQEPFPDIISKRSRAQFGPKSPFRHREVVRGWVESLFNRNEYRDFVEFSTTVELAVKVGDEWVLTLRKETEGDDEKNFWWQETFDAIVVATGHYNVPFVPNISGLVELNERFPSLVQHSKQYRDPEHYRGKKVIVVGASVSSFDIVHDILSVVKLPVYASLRSAHPVFGYVPFTHPEIVRKPQITQVNANNRTVSFFDGSKLEDVDHIIFATGYNFSLPFLPSTKVVNRRIPGLYQHIFKQDDPTLTFIGGTAGGFTFRVFEWQAVAISRFLAGRASLPSIDVQKRWEADRLALVGDGVPFYKIAPRFEEYFEALRSLAGEPGSGVPGRVLPKWDPKWALALAAILEQRMQAWKEKAAAAEKRLAKEAGASEVKPVRAKL
ncbi:Thiol-specific monooxygenase [Lachnellula suecica]|uniref:Thiol-specific monooxygenase n=1 Tax=Lachnellula suecica TaxID=602035 RepID=A0A8T9BXH5_9HELO|nr:Thiol-specific monooxygenase [Lachnellula suecica]